VRAEASGRRGKTSQGVDTRDRCSAGLLAAAGHAYEALGGRLAALSPQSMAIEEGV